MNTNGGQGTEVTNIERGSLTSTLIADPNSGDGVYKESDYYREDSRSRAIKFMKRHGIE